MCPACFVRFEEDAGPEPEMATYYTVGGVITMLDEGCEESDSHSDSEETLSKIYIL